MFGDAGNNTLLGNNDETADLAGIDSLFGGLDNYVLGMGQGELPPENRTVTEATI